MRKNLFALTSRGEKILLAFFLHLKQLFSVVIILMTSVSGVAQSWTTTGNSGLDSSNFLGNTDSVALIFRTNNTERFRIAANGNMSLGSTSDGGGYKLYVNGSLRTTSNILVNNISIGSGAGTGTNNVVVGTSVLAINTTGYANSVFGQEAMQYNRSGNSNVVVGYQAHGTNVADSGVDLSVSIGPYSRLLGSRSVALGYNARANSFATALGYDANASMGYSIAIGHSAATSANNGNIAIGASTNAGYQGNIVLGYNLQTTGAYQLLIGHGTPGYATREVYIGGGVTQTLAASYAPLTIQPTGQSGTDQNGQTIRIATGKGTGTGASGDIHFMTSTPTTTGTSLQSLASTMMIKGSTGYVGIGTATPAMQLHTTGTVRFAGLASDTTRTRVLVADINGNLAFRTVSSIISGGTPITGTVNYIAKYTDEGVIGNSMVFENGTSVGIGTVSIADTGYRLFVEKGIYAQKVKVDVDSWADYVFDNGYKLPSIEEVARHIVRYKRLPGVPDEKAVKKEGFDLGDNQILLLKKIEELTLYAIQLNNELRELRKIAAAMK